MQNCINNRENEHICNQNNYFRIIPILLNNFLVTSALRLLALRGWWILCVRQRRPLGVWVTLINYNGNNIAKYVSLISLEVSI